MSSLSTHTGGIYSHDTIGLVLVPVAALAIIGHRSSLAWLLIIVLFNLYYFANTQTEIEMIASRNQTLKYEPVYYLVLNITVSAVTILMLLFLGIMNSKLFKYVKENNQNLDNLNAELHSRSDQLLKTKQALVFQPLNSRT